MEFYETRKEAKEAASGRDVKILKVTGGWAVMEWSEYNIWCIQLGKRR